MKTVLNKQQIREICRAYENGEVKRTICERYSISQKRLEEILKERKAVRKVPVKPKGRVSQNTKNKHSLYNVCKKWDVTRMILLGIIPVRMGQRFLNGFQDANSVLKWLEKERGIFWVSPVLKEKS